MDATERLLAVEEIKILKARYFRLVDSKQWTAWEQLFTPDAVTNFPDDLPDRPPLRTRGEFVAASKATLNDILTIHTGHTPDIEILSPTTARGTWAMQDILEWPGETALPEVGFRKLLGWGYYHETYTKSAEGWRISSLTLKRLRLEHV